MLKIIKILLLLLFNLGTASQSFAQFGSFQRDVLYSHLYSLRANIITYEKMMVDTYNENQLLVNSALAIAAPPAGCANTSAESAAALTAYNAVRTAAQTADDASRDLFRSSGQQIDFFFDDYNRYKSRIEDPNADFSQESFDGLVGLIQNTNRALIELMYWSGFGDLYDQPSYYSRFLEIRQTLQDAIDEYNNKLSALNKAISAMCGSENPPSPPKKGKGEVN